MSLGRHGAWTMAISRCWDSWFHRAVILSGKILRRPLCRWDLLIYQCHPVSTKDTEDINAAPRSRALLASKKSLEHWWNSCSVSWDFYRFDEFWILEMIPGRVFLWFPRGCWYSVCATAKMPVDRCRVDQGWLLSQHWQVPVQKKQEKLGMLCSSGFINASQEDIVNHPFVIWTQLISL